MSKAMKNIEQKMQGLDENSIRYQILQHSKDFKASWINLGQALYTVWKDKLYRDWGYVKFESYTSKEIGIRKQTASKLLKSYYFLEKEEPQYLKLDYRDNASPAAVPTYESVDLLRRASKSREVTQEDYNDIKKRLFESGRDTAEVKKGLTALIRQRQELAPEETWKKKRIAVVKRLLGTLRSLRTELKTTKMLPAQVLKDTEKLIRSLESELT